MMTAYDRAELFHTDFPAYVHEMNRRLRELDAAIAAKEAAASPESFREQVALEAVASLAALGFANPRTVWRLGVVATRVWLLEIASPPVRTDPMGLERLHIPGWRSAAIAPADSEFGRWQLWRYVVAIAQGVREERLARKFGPAEMTRADLEEARLRCEISHEQWAAILARARWVLAPSGAA